MEISHKTQSFILNIEGNILFKIKFERTCSKLLEWGDKTGSEAPLEGVLRSSRPQPQRPLN